MWARLKPKPRLSRLARRGLRQGTRVEREHVYSRRAAEAIAAQHLAERPDYYRRLLRYVENPGEVLRAGKGPFQDNAIIRGLQKYAWEKHGKELSYYDARDAMRAMLLKDIHEKFRVVEGGKRRANPRRRVRPGWLRFSRVKKVVYHATNAREPFTAFDTTKGDLGAHFGTLDQANYILERRREGENARIIPVWLNLRSPLRLKDVGSFHGHNIAPQLVRKGVISRETGARWHEAVEASWRNVRAVDQEARQAITSAGYDGVVYKNGHEGSGDSYLVFSPGQIKSAIGNRGEFSPESPEMANPPKTRFVFGGMSHGMPTPILPEPTRITGLRLGKTKVLETVLGGFRLYTVDGIHVRKQWADFIAGGNPFAYKFVPPGEIWVDSGLRHHWDKVCIAWHELFETMLMWKKGWPYAKAHLAANRAEQELRGYDRRMVGYDVFLKVVLGNMLEQFPNAEVEKLREFSSSVARGLNRL